MPYRGSRTVWTIHMNILLFLFVSRVYYLLLLYVKHVQCLSHWRMKFAWQSFNKWQIWQHCKSSNARIFTQSVKLCWVLLQYHICFKRLGWSKVKRLKCLEFIGTNYLEFMPSPLQIYIIFVGLSSHFWVAYRCTTSTMVSKNILEHCSNCNTI